MGLGHAWRCRVASVVLILASPSLAPLTALAKPESKGAAGAGGTSAIDKARAQFQQGLALETAGDWAGALSIFQQVAAVKLTPQVRFHVGLCEEHLGRLAAALGDYELAAHEAEEAKVAEVSQQVSARRDELRARIPKLTIVRGAGAEYASISLDGVSLGSTSIGVELPVDPGPHGVEARASGFKPFTTTVDMAEKELRKVEVKLERIPMATAAETREEPEPVASARDTAPAEAPKSSALPFIIGGVGVASLGAAGVFFLLRQGAINKLDDNCSTNKICPVDQQATYDQGKTYTLVADVTLGVGIAGVALGTVLLLTQKKPKQTSTALMLAPTAAGAPGASLVGTF
jgi:tetratricopeptide (TPR) repeat protein